MRTAQIHRRLEKLSAKIRPNARRSFTFEELCRLYWRTNKRGFLAMARALPHIRIFAASFEREDAERGVGC
jgi:hypothetical protein